MAELSLQTRIAKYFLHLITRAVNRLPLDMRRSLPDRAGKLRQKKNPDLQIRSVNIGGVECEWVYLDQDDNLPVIVYFHGGGYVTGSLLSARVLATNLALNLPVRLLTVNYRLAPEYPFPAALDDAIAVYRNLIAEGINPAKVALIGDSAGGGLSLAATMAIRDSQLPTPACIVLLSPWTDLASRSPSLRTKVEKDVVLTPDEIREFANLYGGKTRLDNPYMSPVYGNFNKLPPILIHVGSDEILLDDANRVTTAAHEAGVDVTLRIWPGMFHVFSLAADLLPEARESMAEVTAFLLQQLTKKTATVIN